ncbi:YqaA family protein [Tenacibaculum maritimum]|uniref:Short-chain dehydrogenase n=1 Tax=Tenacibaculum maritimum NCIMB 2154 TaxID=1349785 RepID=A0A2H1E7S3_9FLAO|nr:short-chain dehydrogenase [Tenacibaculum maritimum]MCD9561976.1 short-chain dehydrogenase [Tenacibaculum maritimum]MCD9565060.1 short-chain dehydrogenase [Tenacibaculum maritimum]MCD9579033.1 short-chain dehydrogenase [Tenacibaculum maritimum]MCD9582674.1 short-chain dehydrogenase [Tenacibaculum maritimum]MCD9583853.1 short-chain dehydrogenase [Tenacibaculum maritimum]
MAQKRKKSQKEKAKLLHNYYARTGFYMFIWESLKKAFWPVVIVVVGLVLFNNYVYNINDGLQSITETFSRFGILTTFFISETLLGLIPPEIFIAWSKKTAAPILNLSLLATLSYTGGILSYFIGKAALKIPSVKEYLEVKMAKNLKNTSKWGGFLIIVGALLPIPFSITCMAGGMIKYPLKGVVLFGLFRFLRFAIYAWAIFKVVN